MEAKLLPLVLGIDTSAYTTSLAVVSSNGEIIFDGRIPLPVPTGSRGLRQSVAREMHKKHLPLLMAEFLRNFDRTMIRAVAVSDRPRPLESSYMPVFLEGLETAEKISGQLHVPLFRFSHQEGHIAAIKEYSPIRQTQDPFLCFHISGGTTELLKVRGVTPEIIGGTRDLSVGQVLDRIGVALGIPFPAGAGLDAVASRGKSGRVMLTPIPVKDAFFHLSGIESQCQRRILEGVNQEDLAAELFAQIALCLSKASRWAVGWTGCNRIIMAGGVSRSMVLKTILDQLLPEANFYYGTYGTDNGIGTALLGGSLIWHRSL